LGDFGNTLKGENREVKRLSLLLTVTIIALLVISSLVSCTAQPGKPIILRWQDAGAAPDQEVVLKAAAARINERIGDKCTVEYHSSGELVQMMEMFDAVRENALEMACYPMAPFAGVEPTFNMMNAPFMINSIEAHVDTFDKMVPKYSEIMEAKYNQKLLGAYCAAPLEVAATRPVETMEDWKGLLCQTLDPGTTAIIESLGGSPVPIPFIEAYPSLQKGVVEATIQATNFTLGMKLYEVVTNLTICTLSGPSMVMIPINLDTWNSLPKDVQDVLIEEMQRVTEEEKAVAIAMVQDAPKALADLGVDVYYLPKAERDRWQEALRPYNESLIAGLGEFGQETAQIFEESNSKYPYPF
jgi:TRAP-type C4-dicarboxylate transport system substrate-binding protein